MSKLNVGIVCGGCSLEHEVSLESAMFIAEHIDKSRFVVLVLWIDKRGNWYLIQDAYLSGVSYSNKAKKLSISLNRISNKCSFYFSGIDNLLNIDVIFPIVHGNLGEDGSLQGLLRVMNLPYVGSNILGSSICMDKDITNRLLRDAGLPIVPFKTFLIHDREKIRFDDLVDVFGLSLFIKPVNQGSSIGVSRVNNKDEFNCALNVAFALSRKIVIEPVITGRELECAVLGNDNPQSSVCGEIIVRDDNFYTYDSKYVKHNADIIIPALITNEISERVRYISIQAFQILNCFGMARVDFFLTADNQIIVNEVNTLPGFTINSMYPKLWEMTGLCIQLLLTKLIELALDCYHSDIY